MQNMDRTNSKPRELTDSELEQINGGSILGRIVHFIHDIFAGPGDLRRPTNQP